MDLNIPRPAIKSQNTVSFAKSRKTSLVEVVLLIVVIVLFFLFVVQPKRTAIHTQESRLEQSNNQKQKIAGQIAVLRNLVEQLNGHQKEIGYLDEALPFEGRTTKLQILLNDLTASSGVTVGDINITSENDQIYAADKGAIEEPFKAKRSLKKLTANVYVMGTYEQLKTFLEKIETSGRIIDITSLEISGSQDDKLDLRSIMTSHYYAP